MERFYAKSITISKIIAEQSTNRIREMNITLFFNIHSLNSLGENILSFGKFVLLCLNKFFNFPFVNEQMAKSEKPKIE